MTYSLKDQINAIRIAREILSGLVLKDDTLCDVLNDAGSTITSLNLTKEVKSEREAQLEEALKDAKNDFVILSDMFLNENDKSMSEACKKTAAKISSLLKLNT